MQPVVERAVEFVGMGIYESWELTLESWNDVVKGKGVGREVYPSGVRSKNSKGISGPESVVLVPAGDIRLLQLHILSKTLEVEFEIEKVSFWLNILFEDRGPFLAIDIFIDELLSSGLVSFRIKFS